MKITARQLLERYGDYEILDINFKKNKAIIGIATAYDLEVPLELFLEWREHLRKRLRKGGKK